MPPGDYAGGDLFGSEPRFPGRIPEGIDTSDVMVWSEPCSGVQGRKKQAIHGRL
jgi:hypothetical protein